MKKILAILVSFVLLLAGAGMLCATGDYIQIYDNSISSCQMELLMSGPKNIGNITLTPYTFDLKRCIAKPATLSGVCLDCNVEPPIFLGQCEYTLSNYRCELFYEYFELLVYYNGSGTITVNGRDFNTSKYKSPIPFLLHDSQEYDPDPRTFEQIPSSVTISANGDFNSEGFGVILERQCCWGCSKKPVVSAAILYPKVDIENFNVAGGPSIIKDGKVLSSFEMSPGIQEVFLQVENRGFFTQNDARVRFEGLPQGVTVKVTPGTQIIKAHNIATYGATFTLESNVPSGTYKVTMVAFSPNGVFDRITFDFIVS